MNRFSIYYTKQAKKALKNLDKPVLVMIKAWLEKNLLNTENPRKYGKALKGKYSGYWRYRIGSYRIIAEIRDNELMIIFVDLGHRKEIYR